MFFVCSRIGDFNFSLSKSDLFNNVCPAPESTSNCWILLFIYTPVPHPVNQQERNYNNSQKITRSGVERTIGRWKRRFPCLYFELQNKLRNVTRIITACAVLYNLGIQSRDLWEMEELEGAREIIEIPVAPVAENGRAIEIRRNFIQIHF